MIYATKLILYCVNVHNFMQSHTTSYFLCDPDWAYYKHNVYIYLFVYIQISIVHAPKSYQKMKYRILTRFVD